MCGFKSQQTKDNITVCFLGWLYCWGGSTVSTESQQEAGTSFPLHEVFCGGGVCRVKGLDSKGFAGSPLEGRQNTYPIWSRREKQFLHI